MADPLDLTAGAAAAPAAAQTQPIPETAVANAEPAAALSVSAAAELPPAAAGTDLPVEPVAGGDLTLLEQFDAAAKAAEKPAAAVPEVVAEAKPEDGKPGEVAKPEEAKPAEPVLQEAIDYFASIKLPETLQVDDAMKGDVTKAFDAFRADPATGAQALIDLHNKSMTDYAEHMQREQMRVWNDTRKAWRTEVMADPKLGGSRYQTEMGKVAQVRDAFISDASPGTEQYLKDRAEFESFLRVTGAGDHPAFLRMMHNAHRFVGEPAMPKEGAKPPLNNGRSPSESRRERMYNNTPQP